MKSRPREPQIPTNLKTEGRLRVSVSIPLGADRVTDTELVSAPQTFHLAEEAKIKQWSFTLPVLRAGQCSGPEVRPREWTRDAEKRPSDSGPLLHESQQEQPASQTRGSPCIQVPAAHAGRPVMQRMLSLEGPTLKPLSSVLHGSHRLRVLPRSESSPALS